MGELNPAAPMRVRVGVRRGVLSGGAERLESARGQAGGALLTASTNMMGRPGTSVEGGAKKSFYLPPPYLSFSGLSCIGNVPAAPTASGLWVLGRRNKHGAWTLWSLCRTTPILSWRSITS